MITEALVITGVFVITELFVIAAIPLITGPLSSQESFVITGALEIAEAVAVA